MEKMNENGKVEKSEASGIKKLRLEVLKGRYQKPSILNYAFNNSEHGDCSDMASMVACCPSCHTSQAK